MSQNMVHTITLKAVDGTSVVFQRIGQSANAAAAQIEGAGKRGARGLNEAEQAANRTEASMKKLQERAVATGAALGTGFAVLSRIGQAAETQRRQIQAIDLAYGDAADQVLRFADALQGTTRFSNDDVREAAAIAATLAQNYGFTTQEVERLIRVSADLASLRGIDLSDAVQRTSAAMRGEAESAEFLGLTLNQQAIDRQGLTLTMSQEEAAHFRLNALLEQAAFAQGAAGDSAETAAGQADQLRNRIQDLSQQAGGAIGPISGMASGLADVALALPLLGAAAGRATPTVVRLLQALGIASGGAGLTGAAAAAAPLVAALGTAAVVAAPAILAVAAAGHQAAEAQERWNKALADRDQFLEANPQATPAQDESLQEIERALRTFSTNTTTTIGDTTVGLDGMLERLYDLDTEGVKHIIAVTDALGQITPDNIHEVTQAIAVQSETQRVTNEARLREQYELIEAQRAWVAQLNLVPQAATSGQQFLSVFYETARQGALDAAEATQHLLNLSGGGQFNDPSIALGIGGDRGPGQIAQENADRDTASQARLAEQIDETNRFREEAVSRAQEHAAAMDAEAQAAVTTADALIGSADDRAQSVLRAAEAEEQYSERVSDINSNLSETLGDLQEGYADQTADIAQRRVDIEEQAAERMQSLNEARIDAAKQAEGQLADVAEQRADIVANAAEQAQRAEAAWMQTAGDNLQAQADVRERLQETTADAAQKWHDLNEQNLEQQRAIRVELQTTIADIQRELHASQQEAQRDLQRLAQDHRTAMADFRLDASRIREDLALVINDPRATAAQKNAAELAAQRQLQDLKRQERDEEDSHDRAKEDIRRGEREAIADAARQEADAREKARTDYQQLAEERAAAEQAYHEQVSQANEQAADQLANLAEQRSRALASYQQQQADAHQQTADQLADLQSREQEILEQRAEKYADIEAQRQKLQQDTADQQEALAKQAADAEQQFNESVADAQNAAAEQRIDAQKQYAEATKSDMTELQRLREEGLITEGEYRKIYNELIEVQQTSKDLEDQKLLIALKQIDAQEQLLDIERDKAKARARGEKEPDDPLDGPPRRLLGGMARLGTLVGEAGSELAIKGSRMWEVGRSGPEILNLASGTLIMPHGAAQARMRGMALGGHATDSVPQVTTSPASRRGQGSTINNYGTITIKVDNADIGSEIARQMAGQRR